MKIRHKKILISMIAVATASVLTIGALLQSSVSVQASAAMMPGIEEIVNETSKEAPFRILEIVDGMEEAEIGYYVSGQEPYIKLYEYTYTDSDENKTQPTIHFTSLEDGLSRLPEKQRKEFAMNVKLNENGEIDETASTGIKKVNDVCYTEGSNGDEIQDYPLSYTPYEEKYFLSDGDSKGEWTEIPFKSLDGESNRTDTVQMKGEYKENPNGNGDYTRQEQVYYPICEDSEDSTQTEKYRENIQNFYYSEGDGASAPYYLEFAEVDNETVNQVLADKNDGGQKSILPEYNYTEGQYGYYENVYADLTESMLQDIFAGNYTFPGENPPALTSGVLVQDNSPKGANAFSEGEEDFSSGNVSDSNAAESDVSQADFSTNQTEGISANEDFSSGDFSSGEDENVQQDTISGDTDISTGNEQNAAGEEISDEQQTEESRVSVSKTQTPQIEFAATVNEKGESEAGKATDPYVYLDENIEQYPYYKYTLISDIKRVQQIADENKQAVEEGTFVPQTGSITLQDGQYWYWKVEEQGVAGKYPLSVVSGRQPVSYNDVVSHTLPDDLGYNYYFKVEMVYFCCKIADVQKKDDPENYKYYGWYYPSYPDENIYIKADGKTPTHFISNAEYKLTPDSGNYDFIPDEGKNEQKVQVNHIYYRGGYKNHDWLKRYVFHLLPKENDSEEEDKIDPFKNFDIQVNTLTVSQFDESYGTVAYNMNLDNDTEVAEFTDSGQATSEEDGFEDGSEENSESRISALGKESEVEPMTSEAGVELVSIENEINDGQETSATADAFFAGTVQTTDSTSDLKNYDLIYINGTLTSVSANAIAATSIPCVINTGKNMTEFEKVFDDFIKSNDSDGHYVNKYMYFFKNTWEADVSFLNKNFHKNFNTDAEEDFSDTVDSSQMKGFEEILQYIESENQYRQIENSSDSSGETELLSTEISQARIVEYIINYKYKRQLNTKSSINVLEIEPTKVTEALSDKTILGWLSKEDDVIIDSVVPCCEEETVEKDGTTYKAGNILKNDNSFWHTKWNFKNGETRHSGNHYIIINFENPSDISGFEYTPRQYNSGGDQNGKIQKFKLTLYDKNGNEKQMNSVDQKEGEFLYNGVSDSQKKVFTFKSNKTYTGVASVKIEITQAYTTNDKTHASGAYLRFFNDNNTTIEVNPPEVMTSSEYVGHIDDINSKYDMIYIGASGTRTKEINGDGDKMLYTHVGGLDTASETKKWLLMGMYPQDFQTGGIDFNRNSPTARFRGSGNDITKQQYNELMSFVKSGYPVIIADDLVSGDKINTETVDNSSYMYQFLNEAWSYDNVMTVSEIEKQRNGLIFYANVAKPQIVFSYKPPEAPRAEYNQNTDTDQNVYAYIENQQMEYRFKIIDNSAVSPVNTRYDCRLYFDLNFDGNLSDVEEQAGYMEIRDSSGTVQARITSDADKTGYYQLKADEEYTLIRKIPSDYYKLIAWKLEIINNSNRNVRTSVMGYSKQHNVTENGSSGEKIPIDVLQIVPDFTSSDDAKKKNLYKNEDGVCVGGTWDLATEINNNPNGFLATAINNLEDFEINITRVTVSAFGNDPDTYLDEKEMVIIGFDDVYENIELSAVEKILDFIKAGKSVIFSHDTTSYYNYTKEQMKNDYNTAYSGNFITGIIKTYTNKGLNWEWGVSLNKILREIVGMDRYGITSDREFSSGQSVSDLLKEGTDLTDGENGVSLKKLMELAGDVAYQTGSSGKSSYKETQGYANAQITNQNVGVKTTSTATKVNDGAIVQYPYQMEDTITIANTHLQYYQLALEQDYDSNKQSDGKNDIVVWYCLGGDKYNDSPNDVRNNYYFYSKGNVIYTGAGHSVVTGDMEIKLFINAMVAAANVAAVEPEVNFIKKEDPAAEVETVRYYMTDQTSWAEEADSGNLLEKDMSLYFNVKDYNMVSASLSNKDNSGKSMNADIYIESDDGEVLFNDGPMKNKKVKKINSEIGQLTAYKANPVSCDESGSFPLENNNAYGFSIKNIERYLKTTSYSYKTNLKVYVQITSKVNLYGSEKTKMSYAEIDLKQRQLFELD